MIKYTSNTQKNLKVGITSYSEGTTSLQVVGNVGIGTTSSTSSLSVVGDAKVSGVTTTGSLNIRNPANTFGYTIAGDAIAADITLTLPVVTSNTGIAVTGLNQTFTGTQTFSSLTASAAINFTTTASNINIGTGQITPTLILGGGSQTGTMTLGRSTASQTTNIQAGASGVGTTKTINLGTGGLSGSFTQINIGPTAGVGTVTINSGTNLGIGSATPTVPLDVVGNGKFTGILTATTFSGNLANTLTLNTSGTGLSGSTTFNNSGASTFTVTSNATSVNTNNTIVSRDASGGFSAGIITATQFSTGSGNLGFTTDTISGPSIMYIDPSPVGVGTTSGIVRILGDLYVDGTQFIVNSTTIELADFNVGIASTVGTNLLLDGAGIGIGSTNIRKTITWNNTAGALTSSEDWNLASGKQYEIGGTSVLSSTTLGSGVVNSSLTSVGTLGQLQVTGVSTVGFITAQNLYVAGVGTFLSSGLKIRNSANTFQYNITGGAIAADRTLNLPVITGIDTVATLGLSQTFGATNTYTSQQNFDGGATFGAASAFNSTLNVNSQFNASGQMSLVGSSTGNHTFGTAQTTGTLTFGGTAGTGLITFGRSTATQQTDIQAGASGVGTTKTINLGTGGLSGSFTSINIGPTAGVGTVAINAGTNVGIGSTIPTSKLDVVGDGKFTGVVTATKFFGDGSLLTNLPSAGIATNVIGGIASVSQLSVSGVSTLTSISVGGTTGINQYVLTSTGTGLSWQSVTGIGAITGINIAPDSTNTASYIPFVKISTGTTATEYVDTTLVYNSSTQNLGIGTTNPTEKVSVLGKIQLHQDASSNNRIILRGQPGSSYRWNIDNYGSVNDLRIFREDDATAANGATYFSISNTGTLTATKFSGDGSLLTNLPVNTYWSQTSVGINTLSNVGIGTTNPTSKLFVTGDASISGILTADQVYTSNNGNGTNIRIGDDLWIGDINVANTTRFSGAQNSDRAFIVFGNSNTVALGRTAAAALYYGGDFTVAGVVTATTFSGQVNAGVGTITTLSGTTASYGTINVTTGNIVTGVITNAQGTNLNYSGIATVGSLNIGATQVISSGRQLQNIASLDATTTATIESAIAAAPNNFNDLQVTGISTFTNGPVLIGSGTSTGTASQPLQVTGGAYVSGNLGIGTANPGDALTVSGKIQLLQNSGSLNRIIFRGQPSSLFRWSIDNNGSTNDFRIFREDDATATNGVVYLGISTGGNVTATTFSGTTVNATTGNVVTGVITNAQGTNLNYSGIGTIGTLNSTSGTITTLSGTTASYGTINVTTGNIVTGVITNAQGTNINYSGIGTIGTLNSTTGTITTLSGTTASYGTANITTGNIVTGIITNAQGTNINYSGIGTIGTLNSTTGTITTLSGTTASYGTINATTGNIVTGIITNAQGTNINYSGIGTITTFNATSSSVTNRTGTNLNISGVGTIPTLNSTTINATTGAITNAQGTNLNYSGISTLGSVLSGNINSSGVVTATSFVGSGANLTSLNATQLTSGTVPGARITSSGGDFTVGNNLFVNGVLSVGGTSVILNAAQLRINDRDITLGITTDALGNDVSNDNTANHGGIAIASTVGTPIINIPVDAVNNDLATYKQIMWIRQGYYSGLGTDAWVLNYGVSIGNTATVQTGSRLTVGAGFTVYETVVDLQNLRTVNINSSGIGTIPTLNSTSGTITTLSGTTASYGTLNVTTGNIVTGVITNAQGTNINYSGIGTIATFNATSSSVTNRTGTNLNISGVGTIPTLNSTTGTITTLSGTTASYGTINVTTANIVTGVITNAQGTNINYSGVGTIATLGSTTGTITTLSGTTASYTTGNFTTGNIVTGIITNAQGTNINYSGIGTIGTLNSTTGTITTLSGTTASYGTANITTGNIVTGIVTNVQGTNLNYSGIATVGSLNIGATQVISTARQLQNIASLDATTTATIESAIAAAPNNFNDLNVTGISTFSNGPVLIGVANSTGTATQRLQVTGGGYISTNTGIGVTNPTSLLQVQGNALITGIATVNSNLVVNGNTLVADATNNRVGILTVTPIQPFQVGSTAGTSFVVIDTLGDLGIGTTNPTSKLQVVGDVLISGVVTATSFVGSGANLTNLNATQLTSGTVPGARITSAGGDFTVGNNLFVNGVLSVGGTSIILNAAQLQIADKNIVLGVTTDALGNDVSNDNTANNGGVSIASTVGTPLINIPIQAGINSNPSTYKQFMWIKQNNYSGLGTDGWVSNYAISIGNTATVQTGSRLTVGAGFTVYETVVDLQNLRAVNINSTGVGTVATLNSTTGTITTLSGTTASYGTANFTTGNIVTGIITNAQGTNINYSGIGTIATLGSTTGTITTLSGTTASYGTINATTGNVVTGVITNAQGTNINYSGVGTVATLNSTTGTITTLSGTTASYGTANITTGNIVTGIITNAQGTNLNYTGISTISNALATNLNVSGVGTFLSSGLVIRNPANTFSNIIASSAIAADRTFTLPLVTANTGIAVTGLNQTFTGTQTFSSATVSVTFNHTGATGTLANNGTATATANVATGTLAAGVSKTINLGTGGVSGSFTQINIGPTAGVGTVVINSGTNLGISSATPTSALDVIGNAKISGVVTATTSVITNDQGTNINYSGIGTIATLSGTTASYGTINATTGNVVTGVITNAQGTNINFSGISTFGTLQIASGIVTATSGVITYFGDASRLSNVVGSTISSTAPTSPTAGTLWFNSELGRTFVYYDETVIGIGTDKFWIDAAPFNVGIITTLSNVSFASGTATNPSWYFTNSTTTGVFSPAAGFINFVSVGSTVLSINSGGLNVTGVVTATDFNSLSDVMFKENIHSIPNPLEKVMQINGVGFRWKDTKEPSMGVIAQDIEEVLPELVHSSEHVKTVNYNGLIGVLIEAVKEQQRQIEELKALINK